MPVVASADNPVVGIIANPVSARDIRRVIANAGNLAIADRVNIVLRALTTLASLGVPRVLMMPDKGGIRAMLLRHLRREHNLHHRFPEVEFLAMDPTSTVDDTFMAARMMRAAGVKAIVVLGGDGTHRAVVRECSDIPIAGLSTGSRLNTSLWDLWNPGFTWVDVQLADVNGDGRADLTGRALESGQWFTGLSDGSTLHTRLSDAWSTAVTFVDVHSGHFV